MTLDIRVNETSGLVAARTPDGDWHILSWFDAEPATDADVADWTPRPPAAAVRAAALADVERELADLAVADHRGRGSYGRAADHVGRLARGDH